MHQEETTAVALESLGLHTEISAMDMDTSDFKTPENIEFILPEDSKDNFDTEVSSL